MIKFPEAHNKQDIAIVLPSHLVQNKAFIKKEVIDVYRKTIPDFAERLTVFGAFMGAEGKKPTKKQTTEYVDELYEYLDMQGFQYIFVMDANYFKVMTGKAFEASVGRSLPPLNPSSGDFIIAPIISPLVVKQRAAKLPLFKQAFACSLEIIQGTLKEFTKFEFTTYERIHDISRMKEVLKEFSNYKLLAYDIETTGLHHITNEIITYSLAKNETEAYTFVVHEKYLGKDNAEKARGLFKDFLTTYDGSLIIHNVSFESKFLLSKYIMESYDDYVGMNLFLSKFKFEDTMLMAYALLNSTERVSLSLKDLVKHKYGNYDEEIDVKNAINEPIDKLAYYNAMDVSATFYLYNLLLKDLEDTQLHFYNTEMKNAQIALTRLMATGLMIDMPKVLSAEQELNERISKLDRVFYQNFYVREATDLVVEAMVVKYNETHKVKQVDASFYPDIKFNTNSSPQLRSLIYDSIGFTPFEFTKTKQPSTSRAVIEELLLQTDDEAIKEVLECLIGFSEVSIILNTFIRALKDDSIEVDTGLYRLYPNYRVGGTLSLI